jgi:hypothetical protein
VRYAVLGAVDLGHVPVTARQLPARRRRRRRRRRCRDASDCRQRCRGRGGDGRGPPPRRTAPPARAPRTRGLAGVLCIHAVPPVRWGLPGFWPWRSAAAHRSRRCTAVTAATGASRPRPRTPSRPRRPSRESGFRRGVRDGGQAQPGRERQRVGEQRRPVVAVGDADREDYQERHRGDRGGGAVPQDGAQRRAGECRQRGEQRGGHDHAQRARIADRDPGVQPGENRLGHAERDRRDQRAEGGHHRREHRRLGRHDRPAGRDRGQRGADQAGAVLAGDHQHPTAPAAIIVMKPAFVVNASSSGTPWAMNRAGDKCCSCQ